MPATSRAFISAGRLGVKSAPVYDAAVRARSGILLGLAIGSIGAACSGNGDPIGPRDAGFDNDGGPRFEAVAIPSLPAPEPNFFGVWGTSADDVFLVGERGTIAHWDGTAWTIQPTPTTADLRDVWGLSPTDVYAVGNGGTILHYTEAGWAAELSTTTQDLHAIHGRVENPRVWAVGVGGTIARKDLSDPAALWELQDSGTLETLNDVLIGPSAGGVAVGNLGAIVRLSNGAWSRQRIPELTIPLYGLAGENADSFWVVGLDGTVLRFEGANHTEIAGAPLVYLRRAAGLAGGEIFITGWGGTIARATIEGVTGLEKVSEHRLEGIWATAIEVPDPIDPTMMIRRPRYYIVGVTGTVLIGP